MAAFGEDVRSVRMTRAAEINALCEQWGQIVTLLEQSRDRCLLMQAEIEANIDGHFEAGDLDELNIKMLALKAKLNSLAGSFIARD